MSGPCGLALAYGREFWFHRGMSCFHGYSLVEGNESAFRVDASAITFGPGVLDEAGEHLRALGCRRIALFTDRALRATEHVARAHRAVTAMGIDVAIYDRVHVEPTDQSFLEAAAFAKEGAFDGYLSVGGGSVIDTCKAALLYATYPAPLRTYVNAPIGDGRAVPGPLPPHIACPTTCGTGSECTGIAVFDDLTLKAKTGIASRALRPTHALIDPTCTRTLPPMVVAASGFDVLCHALESYTARPFSGRAKTPSALARPMSQGRNPWSDVGCEEALRLAGEHLVAAVRNEDGGVAREALSWAAALAGIAFGNAGVHLPHAMSYAVAGQVRAYACPGYPAGEPLVPHGISVVVSAPTVVRATAAADPVRHLQAARWLGADVRGATPEDAGSILSEAILALMRSTGVPTSVHAVGYALEDAPSLARGAIVQKRLVDNAPMPVDEEAMRTLFRAALVAV